MNSTKRAVLISIIGTSAFWIGLFVFIYIYFETGTPPFQVKMEYSDVVYIGEELEFILIVSNPTDKPQEIESIDIYNSFLDGFEVKTINPMPDETENILNFRSYYFNQEIGPGESLQFIYQLVPQKVGYFGGDIDVCLPNSKFTSTSVGITIRAESKNDSSNTNQANTPDFLCK